MVRIKPRATSAIGHRLNALITLDFCRIFNCRTPVKTVAPLRKVIVNRGQDVNEGVHKPLILGWWRFSQSRLRDPGLVSNWGQAEACGRVFIRSGNYGWRVARL